jgi:hypothetical protein
MVKIVLLFVVISMAFAAFALSRVIVDRDDQVAEVNRAVKADRLRPNLPCPSRVIGPPVPYAKPCK